MPPPAKPTTGRSIASASSTERPSGSSREALTNGVGVGDGGARVGEVAEEAHAVAQALLRDHALETRLLAPVADDVDAEALRLRRGLDDEVDALPRLEPAHDSEGERALGGRRALRARREVVGVDTVEHDPLLRRDGRDGARAPSPRRTG